MMSKKPVGLWAGLIFLVVIIGAYFVFANIPNIAIYLNQENVNYQYSGEAPLYKYSRSYLEGGQSNQCLKDKSLFDNKIIFSDNQVLTVGSDTFSFLVSNVRQMVSLEPNYYSTCAGVSYDVVVSKNGAVIDSISVPNGNIDGCSEAIKNQRVNKTYGNIQAIFGFDGGWNEGDKTYCGGNSNYLINQYKIVTLVQETVQNNPVTNLPSVANPPVINVTVTPNNQILVSPKKSIFTIQNIIGGIILVVLIISMIAYFRRKR